MKQIASRSALAIDNARRYTREHRHRSRCSSASFPRPRPTLRQPRPPASACPQAAEQTAWRRDWYDAIALPSLRVALVAGDVVGHGMPASATMGRLRAAIQTLADLELEPNSCSPGSRT